MRLLRPSDKSSNLFVHSLVLPLSRQWSREMSQHLLTSQTHVYDPDIRMTENNWYRRLRRTEQNLIVRILYVVTS